jgi:flagellar biosynthetic protein FlhB
MADDAGEKTEQPTPKRRQEARKKGTVAKSQDLNGAVVMLGLALIVPSATHALSEGFIRGIDSSMRGATTEFSYHNVQATLIAIAMPGLLGMFMIFAICMAFGLLVNFAQVGFVMSAESMKPSMAKLNPIQGFKRFFSMKSVVEAIKAIAKGLIFGYVTYQVIAGNWPTLVSLSYYTPSEAAMKVFEICHTILLRIAIVWLVIAALDYFYQRKDVEKQIKMTRDELKREMKEQEGSPEQKGERMRRGRKLSRGSLRDNVQKADVIITNPTHFAVAIAYKRNEMHAPMVVAKGQDFLALKIREMAKEFDIPIVPNPPLARTLHKNCEIGDFVPREQFAAVAEILAYVYKMIRTVKKA